MGESAAGSAGRHRRPEQPAAALGVARAEFSHWRLTEPAPNHVGGTDRMAITSYGKSKYIRPSKAPPTAKPIMLTWIIRPFVSPRQLSAAVRHANKLVDLEPREHGHAEKHA